MEEELDTFIDEINVALGKMETIVNELGNDTARLAYNSAYLTLILAKSNLYVAKSNLRR